MRFTLNWLKEHLETIATPAHIADALVKLGVEVEEVVDPTAHMHNVVIGHVLAREQHPDADRLGVCSVDVGEAQPRQIVCGAPNVRAGLTVAVALEGACLPGDFKIKKSKIRGVESNGMICSARELNLGDDHTGIMELETTAKPGTPFAHTQSFDVVFDVSITPNRADVLSVYGITRDLAAAGLGTLLPLPAVAAGTAPPTRPVHIKGSGTHYFSSIEVTGLTNGTSPQWMQDKLLAAGLRPRNTVVDITNYLMLTYGQPLHAYDAAKVQGGFTATSGNGGKAYKGIGEVSLTTLDDDILIMDETSILGLAGILGGADCAVSDATTHVCLEAAWFNPAAIAASGQAHGIHSDARYRFERGINPTLTAWVGRKAAQMVQELCGGTVSTQLEAGNATPSITPIVFNPQKVTTFGGLTRAQADVVADLKKLGFTVDNETAAQVQVTPPPYRTFMETEEDLVEEVLRLNGLDNVPAVLPAPGNYQNLDSSDLALERKARRALAALGLNETITYSFIRPTSTRTWNPWFLQPSISSRQSKNLPHKQNYHSYR